MCEKAIINNCTKKAYTKFFAPFLTVIFIDRVSKYIAKNKLAFNELKTVVPNKLYFIKTKNYGFANGLMADKPQWVKFFSLMSLCASFFYFTAITKNKSEAEKTAVILLLAGGASNLIDRFEDGYVTDFISFKKSAEKGRRPLVYNIADLFIFLGAAILLIFSLFDNNKSK